MDWLSDAGSTGIRRVQLYDPPPHPSNEMKKGLQPAQTRKSSLLLGLYRELSGEIQKTHDA
jgi:hypothetical protein